VTGARAEVNTEGQKAGQNRAAFAWVAIRDDRTMDSIAAEIPTADNSASHVRPVTMDQHHEHAPPSLAP